MSTSLESRLRAAASAGWRVLLVQFAAFIAAWLFYVAVLPARPEWLHAFLGRDLAWSFIQGTSLWAITAYKLFLWLQACAVLWVWLWARALHRREEAAAPKPVEPVIPPAEIHAKPAASIA
jgi:hypothetical protein